MQQSESQPNGLKQLLAKGVLGVAGSRDLNNTIMALSLLRLSGLCFLLFWLYLQYEQWQAKSCCCPPQLVGAWWRSGECLFQQLKPKSPERLTLPWLRAWVHLWTSICSWDGIIGQRWGEGVQGFPPPEPCRSAQVISEWVLNGSAYNIQLRYGCHDPKLCNPDLLMCASFLHGC